MPTRGLRHTALSRAAAAAAAATALFAAGASPAAAADCGAEAMAQPFIDHIDAAHLERSPRQQVGDLLHLDSYVLAHTTLVDAMLAPLPPTVTGTLEPFEQHLYAAHLERSPMQQVHDLLDVNDYVLAHTVLVESMLRPLLSGCGDDGTTTPAPMMHAAMPAAPAPAAAATRSIAISNYAYDPPSITVPAGTTVTWTNSDSEAHTITGSGLQSKSLSTGGTYAHTFMTAGTFAYYCALHPQMKGTVTVA